MPSTPPNGPGGTDDERDPDTDVYYALADQGRRVFVRLLDRDGRLSLDDALDRAPGPRIAWYHQHLPTLKQADVIAYDGEGNVIPGDAFGDTLGLLDAMDDAGV